MSPHDPLREVFTPEVLARLESAKKPSEARDERLRVLNAGGPSPADTSAAWTLALLRERRAAWDAYVSAAKIVGILDEDLRKRLAGIDDDGFRAAMAECMAVWVVAGKMKLSLRPRPAGRDRSVLEFAIDHPTMLGPDGSIRAEVKAPYRPRLRPGGMAIGDGDSVALAKTIDTASKQFERGHRNLLVIVPSLSMPVRRRSVVHALLGEEKIQFLVNTKTGLPASEPAIRFVPGGRLARLHGQELKPRFTRVSAVLVAEEMQYVGDPLDHQITVVHNPYAEQPIPPELFAGYPQLIRGDGADLVWTDTGRSTVDG